MVAEVQLVEAVLAAGQRENQAIVRHGFGELGVVVAARTRAVAAADQEEVPDGAGLHGVDHRAGHAQHGIVAKADQDRLVGTVLGDSPAQQAPRRSPARSRGWLMC